MKPLNRGGRREQFQTERVLRALYAGCDSVEQIAVLSQFINQAVQAKFLPLTEDTAERVGRAATDQVKDLRMHAAAKALVGSDGKPLNG